MKNLKMKKFNEDYIGILLDSITEGITFLDKNGHIIYMNKFVQSLTEWDLNSAQNKYFSDIFGLTYQEL